MKTLTNLVLTLLVFSQCTTNNNGAKSNEPSKETTQQGKLIGQPLNTVQEKESELGISFTFEILENYNYDIDSDGSDDEIIVEKIQDWPDPGDFHRIRIKSEGKETVFFNNGGWIRVSSYETQHEPAFAESNLLSSRYVVVHKANDRTPLLFAFGYVYASQPGLLSIVDLSQPRLIFNDNYFIHSFRDLNNDATKDIEVTKYDKEEMGDQEKKGGIEKYSLINGWYHHTQ